MSICCEVLGWKSLDIKYLENLMYVNGINVNDALNEIEELDIDKIDINSYIYASLLIIERRMKDKLIEHFSELKDEILDYEPNIYVNYLDSGFDSPFNDYTVADLDDKETARELMNELGIINEEHEYDMTFDEWVDEYDPVENAYSESSFDGYMFETFGEEFNFVKKQNNKNVWTLIDEDGVMIIIPGLVITNRIGHFVTDKPWDIYIEIEP